MLKIQREGVEKNFEGSTLKYDGEGLIKRGKNDEGYIHMLIGLHEDDYKRELTIDITDESLRERGDFSSVCLTKEEVKKLIEFLNKRYREMKKYDSDKLQEKATEAYTGAGIEISKAKFIANMTNARKVAKLNAEEVCGNTGYNGVWLSLEDWKLVINAAKTI